MSNGSTHASNGNGATENGGTGGAEDGDDDVDFISRVDEFIETNFEALEESRELRSLPRIRIEILHLSKEEKEQALAKPLCELALDWIRSQWLEDESLNLETLSERVRGNKKINWGLERM